MSNLFHAKFRKKASASNLFRATFRKKGCSSGLFDSTFRKKSRIPNLLGPTGYLKGTKWGFLSPAGYLKGTKRDFLSPVGYFHSSQSALLNTWFKNKYFVFANRIKKSVCLSKHSRVRTLHSCISVVGEYFHSPQGVPHPSCHRKSSMFPYGSRDSWPGGSRIKQDLISVLVYGLRIFKC